MSVPDDLPICCTLTSEALRDRRARVLRPFIARVQSIERRPDGLELDLGRDDSILAAACELIAVERQCCQFLRFELTADPALGSMRLRLTGPPGTADFLAEELGLT